MKEKIRKEKPTTGGNGSIFDGVPGLPENKEVNVSSGPYSETLPVAGMPVGEVRRKFSDRFDIDAKAQAIVNGVPVEEDRILQGGESLMFIKHAGEKGGSHVVMEGKLAKVFDGEQLTTHSMNVGELIERAGPSISTGPVILPYGIKAVLSQGTITLWFWEQPPRIQKLSWIAEDSPVPYGPGTKYRDVRIALPYLIIMAAFMRSDNGMPQLMMRDECFFRTAPLKSLDDELCYPGLLNCSNYGDTSMRHPLSWICTQYLKPTRKMNSNKPEDIYQASFEAVRYCLLETSFNLSSEHHEGNSWYGESKKKIAQLSTIARWEEETKKDPLFVLELDWIKTGYSVQELADRFFQQHNAGSGSAKTAEDLARIIINR